jgi:HTH-type transcriptional regulator/antitoxin HipB
MMFIISTVDQLTDHLRALRKERGLTQAQAGGLIGVSQNRIADIERDPGSVSMEQMHRLLAALGGKLALQDSGEGWAHRDLKESNILRTLPSTKTGKSPSAKVPSAGAAVTEGHAPSDLLARIERRLSATSKRRTGSNVPPKGKSNKGTW